MKFQQTDKNVQKQILHAGPFSIWLRRFRKMLVQENGIDVPCGECRACCTSFKFIHIAPIETQTLSNIPKTLLFAAPMHPKGTMLMGYDEDGRCPMLKKGNCSIYEYRPVVCRNYDCRIFCAAGFSAKGETGTLIEKHVRRWHFNYPSGNDRILHTAVKAAAKFIAGHSACFPDGRVPATASQLSILALKVYRVFITGQTGSLEKKSNLSDNEIARAIIKASAAFETKRSQ